ncbi:MAG: hypothetical protein KAI80_00335, partial [Hyphomicrobiaceae bacterium]|nr:hypothetical protein [Hyphomicrobiaceae bacterium]
LRLTEGVGSERFADQTGGTLKNALDARRLGDLAEEGLLELDEAGFRATAAGRQRLNALLSHLLNG